MKCQVISKQFLNVSVFSNFEKGSINSIISFSNCLNANAEGSEEGVWAETGLDRVEPVDGSVLHEIECRSSTSIKNCSPLFSKSWSKDL